MPDFRVGLNPLPWVLTPDSFDLSLPVLRTAFSQIETTPFKGIHADPPAELDVAGYRSLLAEFGLEPAPGYFSADFQSVDRRDLVEAAQRHAAIQAELGNTEVFLAAGLTSERIAHPSIGYGGDALLPQVIEGVGTAAEAITAEGVTPALHSHVGSTIETESEIRAVLDAVPASVLSFGPDTGHLAWAGITPSTLMTQYADRIAAAHLKDVHLHQAQTARDADANYFDATVTKFTVWTEPGRGDVDLLAAIRALPDTFHGWLIVEVDVPEADSNLASTELSARWITDHLGTTVF
ncbi:inosose dehydratase [Kribbella sp. VKM Ac-2527]|uniref:Inosose dehydratase n=1 Tax=Kribbella caucasensis TaxID=2512215 RepID=A0A4R6KA22_9ACTN|nr:sugar phosphate isomerase/epimerase [Kribbella sp. VKM Ac-2527]TDO46671.1 inosose dehydratase [Kribbella sp. VKM Ac-2527]